MDSSLPLQQQDSLVLWKAQEKSPLSEITTKRSWWDFYHELFRYYIQHGHVTVLPEDNQALYEWTMEQQQQQQQQYLTSNTQQRLLLALNFEFDHDEADFARHHWKLSQLYSSRTTAPRGTQQGPPEKNSSSQGGRLSVRQWKRLQTTHRISP
jgi:hypothetical protein